MTHLPEYHSHMSHGHIDNLKFCKINNYASLYLGLGGAMITLKWDGLGRATMVQLSEAQWFGMMLEYCEVVKYTVPLYTKRIHRQEETIK